MGSPPMLPPPPGADTPPSGAPPAPQEAATGPAQPNPVMQHGTQMVLVVMKNLRAIAKAYPSASPHVQEINDKMRDVMAAIMTHQAPGEPAAPPV